MMRLSKIKIANFKRIKTVSFALSDINILVGANASGKSSIIQALHLATCVIRQAERVDINKTSTVGIEELDYLPSDEYNMLGHGTVWGNKKGSSSSKVEFTFSSDEEGVLDLVAHCELRSARNAGISITGQIPGDLAATLRAKQKFFSAYIPGISGIPNREEKRSRKVVLKACSYGDSNVILRNVLLLLKQKGQIAKIQQWIAGIIGEIKIFVEHDEEKDLIINCDIEIDKLRRPIELIGTGYIQLIQLFSYVLLFSPGILLVDEPDIHLHPSVQEKLAQTLADVARERSVRILLTTHSPFIVRGAPPSANVYWVAEGEITSSKRDEVELALGWGAFGKKIIIVSEDTKTSLLRKLIGQWPQIDRLVTFYPGTGFRNLPTPEIAQKISNALGGKFKVLVHRDRDSLTDKEADTLIENYVASGVDLWLPELGDIEGYFCQPSFIAELTGCTQAEGEKYINNIMNNKKVDIEQQFKSHRKSHNEEIYRQGGSPTNEEVWNECQNRPLKGAKGKFIFGQLRDAIGQKKFSEEIVSDHTIKSELAPDLRRKLEATIQRA
jgi:ABC-type cobalamin/Fe3+-siderophores transport system ATPase subunit